MLLFFFEFATELCNFVQKHLVFLLHVGHASFVLGVFDLKDGSSSDGVFVGHEEMVLVPGINSRVNFITVKRKIYILGTFFFTLYSILLIYCWDGGYPNHQNSSK